MTKGPGFTVFELLIFIVLFGIIVASISAIIPRRKNKQDISSFFSSLNNLVVLALKEGQAKKKVSRMAFYKKGGSDYIRLEMEDINEDNEEVFIKIKSPILTSEYEFPENISVAKFWSEDYDNEGPFYIYISKDGYLDKAIIHLVDHDQTYKNEISAKTNPFLAKFEKIEKHVPIPKKKKS